MKSFKISNLECFTAQMSNNFSLIRSKSCRLSWLTSYSRQLFSHSSIMKYQHYSSLNQWKLLATRTSPSTAKACLLCSTPRALSKASAKKFWVWLWREVSELEDQRHSWQGAKPQLCTVSIVKNSLLLRKRTVFLSLSLRSASHDVRSPIHSLLFWNEWVFISSVLQTGRPSA